MWVQALSLTDFRSYEQADVEFFPGVTAFIGLNGQGKTNIVEAIAYLSTLSSHRVSQDAPLVRAGAEHAVVRARVCEDDRSVSVDLQINPGGANKVRINRAAATRARDILGIVRAIVFAPEDLSLVRGDPGDRRRFLDDMTIQRHPRVAGVRADYDKVLRQRNALLKSAGGRASSSMRETLSAWDEQLIEFGTDIIRNRQDFIDDVSPHVQQAYTRIAGTAQVNLRYKPSSPSLQNVQSPMEKRHSTRSATHSPLICRHESMMSFVGASHSWDRTAMNSSWNSMVFQSRGMHRTGNHGRWPWRCGWVRRMSCVPTAWIRSSSWMTCSPNSISNVVVI
jgi:DNA replication and repair protein RecF